MNAVKWTLWGATTREAGMSEAVDEKCACFALCVLNTGQKVMSCSLLVTGHHPCHPAPVPPVHHRQQQLLLPQRVQRAVGILACLAEGWLSPRVQTSPEGLILGLRWESVRESRCGPEHGVNTFNT